MTDGSMEGQKKVAGWKKYLVLAAALWIPVAATLAAPALVIDRSGIPPVLVWSGFAASIVGALGASYAAGAGYRLKDVIIDERGVRVHRQGETVAEHDIRWEDIRALRSFVIPDPEATLMCLDIETDGGKTTIGLENTDSEETLRRLFRMMAERLAGMGVPVDDYAGWAKDVFLFHAMERGEAGPDPGLEGRWIPSTNQKGLLSRLSVPLNIGIAGITTISALQIMGYGYSVSGVALGALCVWAVIMGLQIQHIGKSPTHLLIDRNGLRIRFVGNPEKCVPWSDVEVVHGRPDIEYLAVTMKNGTSWDGDFPKGTGEALTGRFALEVARRRKAC
jgi:hypothetical protein